MSEQQQQVIYSMVRVGRVYPPSRQVLRDISLGFFHGAKIGVLGLNGSGKSTLLRIMAGLDEGHSGETMLSKGYTRGMLEQEPKLDTGKTVREVVQEGAQAVVDLLARFNELSERLGEPLETGEMEALIEEQGRVQEEIEKHDGWNLDGRLEVAMDALRCPPGDAPVSVLSGGERRRVALCRLLLGEPDILLLDEPTNHLDAESVAWLERHLREYAGTVIAVTHDRYFLDNVAGWILELDRGHGIPWKGNYSSWLEQKHRRLEMEEKGDLRRRRTLERELEWIRMSPKARQAKGKARYTAYESLLGEETEKRREEMSIYIPPGPRLGNVVAEFEDVAKAFGDRVIFDGLTLAVPSGAIVGVIGPNGSGKTTLLNLISGATKPDRGAVRLGDTVKLAYVDQLRDTLDAAKTVWEEISGGEETIALGGRKMNSRAYVAGFNFHGPDQQKAVGALSGGERNRLYLAKMLRLGANVLLLDEPTNDLDVNTLRALEEALEAFAGSAVIVSHDRWFLDRVATHILAIEDEGAVVWFAGNCSDYEADRRRRLGAAAETPHRLRHRQIRR
ncbi:MAG: energy-dependent translational throttle protein EttA [Myxococcota bacterium]|nr:energy-dependent translational throttle protein EttA [Myxococcota bacterium]